MHISFDPSRHSQESPGLSGPESQKSPEKGLMGVCRRVPEKTRESLKIPIFRPFGYF